MVSLSEIGMLVDGQVLVKDIYWLHRLLAEVLLKSVSISGVEAMYNCITICLIVYTVYRFLMLNGECMQKAF